MNRSYFINNRKYFLPEDLILKNVSKFSSQQVLDEIHLLIKELDNLLYKKNNIDYFLCGGSLIGQQRHRGIIPWDDDGDI